MTHHVRKLMSFPSMAAIVTAGITAAAILAVPAVNAAPNGYLSVPSEPAVGGITPQQFTENMLALNGRLVAELPAGVLSNPLRLDLTADERRELADEQNLSGGPAVVGRTKLTSTHVRISDLDSRLVQIGNRPVGPGVLAATSDGGFVWAGAIASDGATAMRIHFTGLNLPPDAELYVFNMTGAAHGPYWGRGPNDDGELWSHTVGGAETIVMLRQRGPATSAELNRMSFTIADVGHITPDFKGISAESFCSYNVACIVNAECTSVSSTHQNAIALLQWISGAFIYTCTGGLIADTDASTQIPYVLTANHCLNRARDAQNVESFFFYTLACGSTSCPAQANPGGPYGSAVQTATIGTTIKATGTTGDYSLLQLNGPPPSGTTFLGWNNTPIANTNGTALRRVHHPAWAPQSYSEQHVDTSRGTCTGYPRGTFIYSSDDFGGTEGGSSGSPVVNTSGQIVGQLFGACGTNVGDACDNASNATVDGAFAAYYSNVASFLNPSGGGGTCVNPGGAPAGSTCNANSDCCSNNCKGKPGAKVCK